MMQPISIEEYAGMVLENNKGYRKEDLVQALQQALEAKKHGARCTICGAPIWAAGSAITGTNLCFTCTTVRQTTVRTMRSSNQSARVPCFHGTLADFIRIPRPGWHISDPAPCPAARAPLLAVRRG
jgi:hypothetical protein